jgi:hypothetical protein
MLAKIAVAQAIADCPGFAPSTHMPHKTPVAHKSAVSGNELIPSGVLEMRLLHLFLSSLPGVCAILQ